MQQELIQIQTVKVNIRFTSADAQNCGTNIVSENCVISMYNIRSCCWTCEFWRLKATFKYSHRVRSCQKYSANDWTNKQKLHALTKQVLWEISHVQLEFCYHIMILITDRSAREGAFTVVCLSKGGGGWSGLLWTWPSPTDKGNCWHALPQPDHGLLTCTPSPRPWIIY